MARLPYAAQQLRSQVLEAKPRSKVEAHGEPDGLRVHRSLAFSKAAGKWLAPLLEVIDDPRVSTVETLDDGRVVVTFVPTVRADDRTPFPLADVDEVLRG